MYKGKLICLKKCSNCGVEIEIMHKARLNYKNNFCSKDCEIEYKEKNRIYPKDYFNCTCPICNKKFHLKPYHLKKYKTHYCSKECHNKAKIQYMSGELNHQYGLKGNLNASWKSDSRITNYGYVKIRCPEHPFKDCDGFVFEHRLIAEKFLLNSENSIEINGKLYLKEEYSVHHINENKLDNRVENLKVMSKREHCSLHSKSRAKKRANKS